MSISRVLIDVIILAGGLGTRLRPLIHDVPKPLAPVRGRPFLDILLEQLDGFGQIQGVVLAIGFKADHIINTYRERDCYSFDIRFAVEDVPLGTGGAIKNALSYTTSSDVLIMNGDSFVEFDLSDFLKMHEECAADITFLVTEVPDVNRYSSVNVDTVTSRITQISKKGEARGTGFINAGCYLLKRSIFDQIPNAQNVSFEDQILPLLLHNAYARVVKGKFIDIGTPESYTTANSNNFWNR